MRAIYQIGLIFSLAISSCTEIIKLDLPLNDKRLVVEGRITTDPGPYFIRLTNTYDFTYIPRDTMVLEEDAIVSLTDNVGNHEILNEVQPGLYATDTDGIRGVLGRSYTLQISTKAGKVYESTPELLRSVPVIDTIYANMITSEDDSVRLQGFYEFNDLPEVGNYYLVFEQEYNILGNPSPIRTDVLSDKFFNNQRISLRFINSTYLGKRTFQIRLYSISKDAYNFWTQLRYNTDQVGTPYDVPLAPDIGNIFNINDKNDYAIGYFFASSVSRAQFIR